MQKTYITTILFLHSLLIRKQMIFFFTVENHVVYKRRPAKCTAWLVQRFTAASSIPSLQSHPLSKVRPINLSISFVNIFFVVLLFKKIYVQRCEGLELVQQGLAVWTDLYTLKLGLLTAVLVPLSEVWHLTIEISQNTLLMIRGV